MGPKNINQFIERHAPDEDTGWQWVREIVTRGYSIGDGKLVHPTKPDIGQYIRRGQVVWAIAGTAMGEGFATPVAALVALDLNPELGAKKPQPERAMSEAAKRACIDTAVSAAARTLTPTEVEKRICAVKTQWKDVAS